MLFKSLVCDTLLWLPEQTNIVSVCTVLENYLIWTFSSVLSGENSMTGLISPSPSCVYLLKQFKAGHRHRIPAVLSCVLDCLMRLSHDYVYGTILV